MSTDPPPLPGGPAAPLPGAPAAPLAGAAAAPRSVDPAQTSPGDPAQPLRFTCRSCGAQTAYAPGTTMLRCPSCGAESTIDAGPTIVEHSYDEWATLPPKPVATIGSSVLQCQGCGATTETDDFADTCQFCGGVLVVLDQPEGLIAPEAVVPFQVAKRAANDAFTTWVRSRWFAPNSLKRVGSTEAIKGTYIPHWTYDSQTDTDYTGQRGDYYYTTETYRVSDGNGGSHTETRQVRHTAWSGASGHVDRFFDDVLVPASHRVEPKKLQKMGPWTLGDAMGYQPQYLAGYSALRYDVDPDTGLGLARAEMENQIRSDCKRDIGGDEQRVSTMDVQYRANMFKLMLLPLWIASYLFAGQTFQVLVNANTGEVEGDRPYSKLKIAFAAMGALIIIAAIITWVILSKSKSSR